MCDFILGCEDVYLHIHIFLHLLKSKKHYVIVKRRDQIRILLHRTKRYHIGPRKKRAPAPPQRSRMRALLMRKTKGLFSSSRGACVAAGSARGTGERSRLLTSSYQELAYERLPAIKKKNNNNKINYTM